MIRHTPPSQERKDQEVRDWFDQQRTINAPEPVFRQARVIQGVSGVMFYNASGETVPAYACMRITGVQEFPVNSGRYLPSISKPNSSGGPFLFNGSSDVAVTSAGQASFDIVDAKYSSGSPVAGDVWGPLSDWEVVNNGNPAIIIYGTVETNVRVKGEATNGSVTKIGVADANIAINTTGTVSIWRNGLDTTENITGVHLDWHHGSEQISSGKQVRIKWFPDEGRWRFVGADCE